MFWSRALQTKRARLSVHHDTSEQYAMRGVRLSIARSLCSYHVPILFLAEMIYKRSGRNELALLVQAAWKAWKASWKAWQEAKDVPHEGRRERMTTWKISLM